MSHSAAAPGDDVSLWSFDECDVHAAQGARSQFVQRLRGMLVGNVVRHGRGPVEIRVNWRDDAPVLHVRDSGPGMSYLPRLPHDPMAESGRGLYLISQSAEDFNATRGPRGGTHARAIIALSHRRVSA